MSVELSGFHVECLKKFKGVRALTETGLARVMKSEKAVAKHAISVLLKAGYLKKFGAYEYALTTDGDLRLGGKPPAKSTLKEVTADELEPLNVPDESSKAIEQLEAITGDEAAPDFYGAMAASMGMATDAESVAVAAVDVQADNIVFKSPVDWAFGIVDPTTSPSADNAERQTIPEMGNLQIEKATIAELCEEKPANFETLVRQGLARLNAQLGVQPYHIFDADLKIEACRALSSALVLTEPDVSALLMAISFDLQSINDRTS